MSASTFFALPMLSRGNKPAHEIESSVKEVRHRQELTTADKKISAGNNDMTKYARNFTSPYLSMTSARAHVRVYKKGLHSFAKTLPGSS